MRAVRKQRQVFEANQWSPSSSLYPGISKFFAVRADGDEPCPDCGRYWYFHGWADNKQGLSDEPSPPGVIVCPGSWIVEISHDNYLILTPQEFYAEFKLSWDTR